MAWQLLVENGVAEQIQDMADCISYTADTLGKVCIQLFFL